MACPGLSLLVVLGVAAPPNGSPPQPIRVHVAAGADDEALRDSAADLSRALTSRPAFRAVDSPQAADVEVRILDRFRRRTDRVAMLPVGAAFLFLPVEERVVRASLTARDTRLELQGRHTRSWRASARSLADALEGWTRVHEGLLREAPRP